MLGREVEMPPRKETGAAQSRPDWCPYPECRFLRHAEGVICVGELPFPIEHDGVANTHRLCFFSDAQPPLSVQINREDCDWLAWLTKAVYGETGPDR